MFKSATPESAGISSKHVLSFLKALDSYNLCTHSILIARGDKLFTECYYSPFDKGFKHRMYSVSKSFVGVAIGLCEEDGLLSLDDPFVKFFPEYVNEHTDSLVKEMTVRDMLKMETCMHSWPYWFSTGTDDRTEVYFRKGGDKLPGTLFKYDSSASYMLNVIVERVTKKPFLQYMQERVLNKIGFSEDAYCIKCPGGYSFGDSGIVCTSMDLLRFARFVMDGGVWQGERLMNEQYLKAATSKLCDNNTRGRVCYDAYGYGYQIWGAPRGGFAFIGMGDQFAICDRETDTVFIITSDNQGNTNATRPLLYHELYRSIFNNMGESLQEDDEAYNELIKYIGSRKLMHLSENASSPCAEKVSGVKYELSDNAMGIKWFKLDFEQDKGTFTYKKGEKELVLAFGLCRNEFGLFPEEGYSDMVVTQKAPGNFYRCACSADWVEETKMRIKVQIIDKYFGNAAFVISFKDDRCSLFMDRYAEDFMNDYVGIAHGKASV